MSEKQMSEKKETNFVRLEKFLPIMKIRKLYDFYVNGKNATQFDKLLGFCEFPEGKTEEEKIEEIENFIGNFWTNEVTKILDEKYNKNSSLSFTQIKHTKSTELSEKFNLLISSLRDMLNVPEIDLAFSHEQIRNVINFLNDIVQNPNNNDLTNSILNHIETLRGNTPEARAVNFLLFILDNYPEIINKPIPQQEISTEQQHSK